MQLKFKDAVNYFKFGDLEKSKKICEEIFISEKDNIDFIYFYAHVLYSKKEFNTAIDLWNKVIDLNPNHKESLNGKGNALKRLEKYDLAIECFEKALKAEPKFFDAYYNLANVYLKLSNFEKSITNFKKAYNLNPNFIKALQGIGYSLMKNLEYENALEYFYECLNKGDKNSEIYNYIGICLNKIGKYEESIEYYSESLKLNPNNLNSIDNLLNLLTYHNPKKEHENFIIKINQKLKRIDFKFNLVQKIDDKEVVRLLNKIFTVSTSYTVLNELELDQIFRRNKIDLNCERHFKVFNSYNVIPEFCFGCYKIQINPKNILDLIKLYIIFDQFEFGADVFRKTLIEVRPKIPGTYKGLIYCSNKNEANIILEKILPVLKENLGNDLSIGIKRGCSEFAISFPGYEKLDSDLKFNPQWKDKENIIDSKEKNKERAILENSIMGLNIFDAIVLRNWLIYAKMIDDISYKNFDTDIKDTGHMNKILSHQQNFRKKEFNKLS